MYTNIMEFEPKENAAIQATGSIITIKGPKGELKRDFGPKVLVFLEGKKIKVSAKQKEMLNTVRGHIENMIHGVNNEFSKKMKIVYSHFPITVEVKGSIILVKNFLGEKSPRKAKINGKCKVLVKGAEVLITGLNKEEVGQTAANIRIATKIKNRDLRIFQDGIYIIGEQA
ncbi:MAG: 50S ribosomal protein L6 [Candidatus Micrarchaeia archaeon]